MKKFNIVAYAMHPGSSNALADLVKELGKNNNIKLLPLSEYCKAQWGGDSVYPLDESLVDYIDSESDLLLYSPHGNKGQDNKVLEYCKENNILTVAVLDIFWFFKADLLKRFDLYPDIIIVAEESVKKDLESLGVPSEVYALGNPWFDRAKYPKGAIPNVINTLAYISVPIGSDNECPTEPKSINLLKRLLRHVDKLNYLEEIIICTHPRELKDQWLEFIEKNSHLPVRIKIKSDISTTEVCSKVHGVLGVESTILVEELLKGHNVIFFSSFKDTINALNRTDWSSFRDMQLELPTDSLQNILRLLKQKLEERE